MGATDNGPYFGFPAGGTVGQIPSKVDSRDPSQPGAIAWSNAVVDAAGLAAEISRAETAEGLLASTINLNAAKAGRVSANVGQIRTSAGVTDVLAAAAVARNILIAVVVTTVFANGDGGQPTFTIGEESGAANKFMLIGALTNAAVGVYLFAGNLSANKKLQVTAVSGTGTTETGAITIIPLGLPTA